MNKEIVIKIEDLTTFVKKGQELVFKKEAEEAIVALLEYKAKVEEALEQIKKGIEEAGKKAYPDFRGVIGQHIKAIYRMYGERYGFDKNIEQPKRIISRCKDCGHEEVEYDFLKTITFHKVIPEKVNEYIEKNNKVPEGIILKERQPQISLMKVKPQLEEENK